MSQDGPHIGGGGEVKGGGGVGEGHRLYFPNELCISMKIVFVLANRPR